MRQNNMEMKLNEMIHLTLTDHIDGQIQRIRSGVHLSNQLTLEISRVYQNEFQVGKYGNSQVGAMDNEKEVQTTLRFVSDIIKI